MAMADKWSANPDTAECDVLVSTGEEVSVSLFTMLLKDAGIKARSLLGWQIPIITNQDFGNARILSVDKNALLDYLNEFDVLAKVLHIRSVEFAKKYKIPVRVRSTFSSDIGTLVTQEDLSMESVLVSGIAYDKDQARVTLLNVPDIPGIAAAVFGPLSEHGIVVDMIVQNTSQDGHTDMTFTISRKDLQHTLEIMDEVVKKIGADKVMHDVSVAKVSAIGVGMRNHAGVATRAFSALTQEGINILMISTSEIKITILIQEKYVELAVRILHDTFGLDWDIE